MPLRLTPFRRPQAPAEPKPQTGETPQVKIDHPVTLDTSRPSVHEIFDNAVELARSELGRPARALLFSGLAGGMTMGLTGLAVAILHGTLGTSPFAELISMLLYPVGFIAAIIGRAQLFTENTLYPVVLVLSERTHVLETLRLWGLVFVSNVAGAALFALLVTRTSALSPVFRHELVTLGLNSASHPAAQIFWMGVIGGWLIALVAWMVTASQWTIGQIAVIWLLTFVIGLGKFAHCIATSGEIFAAVWGGAIPLSQYTRWIVPATAGNIAGGVAIVSLLNWGQVNAGTEEH